MKVVKVWPKGYADEAGLSTIRVAADADVATAVWKAFGCFAKVYEIKDEDAPKPQPLPLGEQEAYSRMFRGDWS